MAKNIKQDRNLVAGTQDHEVQMLHLKFKAPKYLIKALTRAFGHKRKVIEDKLLALGYVKRSKKDL